MALFGKADENLPLLTHLYQLEYNPDDLEKFGDIVPFMVWFVSRNAFRGDSAEALLPSGRDAESIYRRIWSDLSLVRRIMDAVADNVMVSVEDEFEINKELKQFVNPQLVCALGSSRDPNDGWANEKGQFYGYWYVWYSDASDFALADSPGTWNQLLKRRSLPLLVTAIDKGLLHRCEECSSVYVRTRSNQKYCSDRCKNRAGAKRHYNKKNKPIPIPTPQKV